MNVRKNRFEVEMGLKTPMDLLNKAIREKERIISASNSLSKVDFADSLFNFCVTIHHIRDWVSNSQTNTNLDQNLNKLHKESPALQACRDISNSVKHFRITRYSPGTKK